MNTYHKFLCALFALSIFTGLLAACASPTPAEDRLVIAVVENDPGSASQPNAQSIYSGVRMAVDEINALGGINGQLVEIELYNDNGDPAQAASAARTISQGAAIAVIGHDSPQTSHAAAAIYVEAGLPAINVMPSPESLILDCPTYLNISYTAETQAAYLANYLVKVQGARQASIIDATDPYSQALARQFRNTFRGLDGHLTLHETIDLGQPVSDQVEQIVAQIVSLDTSTSFPGTIYIAAPSEVAAELVLQLRRKGVAYPMAGGNQLNSQEFMETMAAQNEENAQPGFFTDGILSTRGILGDSVQGSTHELIDVYTARYGEAPEDQVLNGYDAALAILAAAGQVGLSSGGEDLTTARTSLLRGLMNLEPLRGAAGMLNFQQNRHAVRPARIAVYQNGELVSAMTQFEPLGSLALDAQTQQALESGRMLTVNGEYVNVVNVVYTGIDLIEVNSVDIKTSTYVLDFYLWFRYRNNVPESGLQPENVVFTNLASGETVSLDTPIAVETIGDTTLRTHRVTATFKNDFSFHEYPFDKQTLLLQMRNQTATASEIQYVVDKTGMQYRPEANLIAYWKQNQAFKSLFGWQAQTASAEQSLLSTNSTLGNPLNFNQTTSTNYSLFRVEVEIQRSSLEYIIKSLLPLLITLVLAYITFFLPLGHSERMGVGSTALLTTAFFHLTLADSLPEIGYTVAMEFLFYAAYLMSTLIVLLETWSSRLEHRSEQTKDKAEKQALNDQRQRLSTAGKVAYPILLAAALLVVGLVYTDVLNLVPTTQAGISLAEDVARQTPLATQEANSSTAAEKMKGSLITLTLSTWRPEDNAGLEVLFDQFETYAREEGYNIRVVHAPIISVNYDSVLNTQFSKDTAADLFYVRPFSVDGPISNHLLTLERESIEENYSENRIEPWRSQLGEIYAMPFGGVVQGVYYNKKIFNELGLSVPTTWQEFLHVSRALKEAEYIPIANTLRDNQDSEMFQSLAINYIQGSEGRALLASGQPGLCFNGARVTGAFNAIAELRDYLPEDADEISSETSKSLFLEGKAAMLFGGSWDLKFISEKAPFDWGVFAPPAPTGMKTYVVFNPDIAIGVNRNSPNREAALLFINWLNTQAAVDTITSELPGFYPLANLPPTVRLAEQDDFLKLTSRYETDARWAYIGISSQTPRADEIIRFALRDLFRGEITGRQAADRLQTGLAEWYGPAQTCLR